MRTYLMGSLCVGALAAAPTLLTAQDPVKWTASTDSLPISQGDTAHVLLEVKVDKGWHVYSTTQGPGGPMPTKITLPKEQPFLLGGPIEETPPEVGFDKNFNVQIETHEGSAGFYVPVMVDSSLKDGDYDAKINARFIVCNAQYCMPAKTEKLTVKMHVKKGGSALRAPARAKALKAKEAREKAKKK